MPIESTHSLYDKYQTQWKRARDTLEGQEAIHKAGKLYLPRLKSQSDEDYDAYKTRASFFNATSRTVDGLVGMIFRKPAQIEANNLDNIKDDIDLSGSKIESFAQEIVRDVLAVSRIGVLVEYPVVNQQVTTQAQAEAINLRPYATIYKTETIINWRYTRINNVNQLSLVVLQEIAKDESDIYAPKEIDQIRELILIDGVYTQRIYHKNETTKKYELKNEIVPIKNGAPLDFIPFYAFGSDSNSLNCCTAPLSPLVDLNLAHYRVTADYEHGCHLSGLPTLFIAGIQLEQNESIYVGGGSAIVAPMPDAHGEYIEVQNNFDALLKNIESKEKQMAVLGARLLEQQKNGVEAAQAMQLRTNGEMSVLAAIANLISDQLANMLIFMSDWAGNLQDVDVHLNTDYTPIGMSAQELTALVQAWQAGAISNNVLFDNLKRGEIISDDADFEEEQQNIADGAMNLADSE